ncbi:hypothetical protein [Trichothermofontia sp.]
MYAGQGNPNRGLLPYSPPESFMQLSFWQRSLLLGSATLLLTGASAIAQTGTKPAYPYLIQAQMVMDCKTSDPPDELPEVVIMAACMCLVENIQTEYTLAAFTEISQTIQRQGNPPAAFTTFVEQKLQQCAQTLSQQLPSQDAQ